MKLWLCIFSLALTGILLSCKKKTETVEKDVIVYQNPVYKWSRVSFFDQVQSNDIKNAVNLSGHRLLFYSTNYIFIYDSTSNTFKSNWAPFSPDLQATPVITNSYCTSAAQGLLLMVPTNIDPVSSADVTKMDLLQFDSAFYNFNFFPKFRTGEMIGNENSLIVPYYTAKSPGYVDYYLCIKIKEQAYSALSFSLYVADSYKKIKASPSPSIEDGYNYCFSAIGSNFLVRMNNGKNYIINSSFDTIPITNDYNFYSFFTYLNQHYAVVSTVSGYKLATTTDQGLTWQIIYDLSQSFEYMNFSQVGDKLICYTGNPSINPNNLYQIIFNGSSISSKELVNDGLQNVTIRSVNMLNNQVFISTNYGVFERPYSEFIDYK